MPRKKEEDDKKEVDGVTKFFNCVTGILILILICMIWAIIPIFIIHHVFLFYFHEMLFIEITSINNAKLPGNFSAKDLLYSNCYDNIHDYPEICKVIRHIYNKNINTYIDIVNGLLPTIIKTSVGEITINTLENIFKNFSIVGQSFGEKEIKGIQLQNIIQTCPSNFATIMTELTPIMKDEKLIQTNIDNMVKPLATKRLDPGLKGEQGAAFQSSSAGHFAAAAAGGVRGNHRPISYKGGNAKQSHSTPKNNSTNKTFLQFAI
jgi:hypothetical protein